MMIYPAIDIYQNKVVRLKQGDFNQVTYYPLSPLEQALKFERDGAKWVHVVDLKGAKEGQSSIFEILKSIKKQTTLSIQTGGGIRDIKTVEMLLSLGIDRVVLGSFAIKDPEGLKVLCMKYAHNIVVAVDCKDDMVTLHGWQETTQLRLQDYLSSLIALGVMHVMITDIKKDGMLQGINHQLYAQFKTSFPSLNIVASGGVTTLDDIKNLKQVNIDGVIVGVALYENKVSLKEAILC
jgi:phosphoribosylformimino-5-aminoimidazole carboxamide ribotide isomerase